MQYPPPHAGPSPYPPQQSGGYPPPQGQPGAPYGQPGDRPRVLTTEEMPSGELRRFGAVIVDLLLAAFAGAFVAQQVVGDPESVGHLGVLLACATATSFVNQVVLGWITRCSVGKFLFFLRFVRAPEGDRVPVGGYGHPPFWRLVGRWLFGLAFIPRALLLKLLCDEPEQDGAGILIVGRRHMVSTR